MFTGIIETTGHIRHITHEGANIHLWVEAPFLPEIGVDESIAHNGICLTVVSRDEALYQVTAIAETIQKTTLGHWQIGDEVNLERALLLGSRLDGHFVQGHVDGTIRCTNITPQEGSHQLDFEMPATHAHLVIEKGSVCIDGTSLTCFDVTPTGFSVAIIPYTWEHTTLRQFRAGQSANMEYDVLAKYLARRAELVNVPV